MYVLVKVKTTGSLYLKKFKIQHEMEIEEILNSVKKDYPNNPIDYDIIDYDKTDDNIGTYLN